jgi:hypothetical protein
MASTVCFSSEFIGLSASSTTQADHCAYSPGVYWLRDPRSGIYNFDPRLRNVLDVDLFDYDTLPPYITSSKDNELAQLAQKHKSKFVGSTSSL